MPDREPNIITSPLSCSITRDDITVEVHIYRLEHEAQWVLEVVNESGTSSVWEDRFDSDEKAFAAFEQAVADEGIEAFTGKRVHEALEFLYNEVQSGCLPFIDSILDHYEDIWKRKWHDRIAIAKRGERKEDAPGGGWGRGRGAVGSGSGLRLGALGWPVSSSNWFTKFDLI